MVARLGPPTLFYTVSQAEYDDINLRDFLCSLPSLLNGSLTWPPPSLSPLSPLSPFPHQRFTHMAPSPPSSYGS